MVGETTVLRGFAAVAVLSLAVFGCHHEVITREDVRGNWSNASGGTLRFDEDGRFSAVRLSGAILLGSLSSDQHDGDGTWKIVEGEDGSEVFLSFKNMDGRPILFEISMQTHEEDGRVVLSFWDEDPLPKTLRLTEFRRSGGP